MNDASQLGAVQRAPGIETDQHRSRRLLLLTKETVLVGQRQMHPRTLHRGQCLNGAGQLAFQAALKRQAFLKLRHAKPVRLHHLKTSHRTFGQTL